MEKIKKDTINLEIKAYNLYLTTNGNIKLIDKASKELNLNINQFLMLVCNFIRNNKSKADYAILFQELDYCDTDQEIIDTINKSNLALEYLKLNFANYISLYRPDLLYFVNQYTILFNKIKIYEEYLKKKKQIPSKINNSYYKQVVQSFLKTNYTLEKFLFMHRIKKGDFNSYLLKVKLIDPDLYNEFIEINKYRESIKNFYIQEDVLKLLNKIKDTQNKFSSIDYFTITNFGFNEVVKVADQIITSKDDLKLFRCNVNKLKLIKIFSEQSINKLFEQSFTYFIDGNLIKLTSEDIQAILNYLKENDIPISNITFEDASDKYLKNKDQVKKI